MGAVKVSILLNSRTGLVKCELSSFITDVQALCSPVSPAGMCELEGFGELDVCDDTEHYHCETSGGTVDLAKYR